MRTRLWLTTWSKERVSSNSCEPKIPVSDIDHFNLQAPLAAFSHIPRSLSANWKDWDLFTTKRMCARSSKSTVLGASLNAECEGTEGLPRNQTSIQPRERCQCSGGESERERRIILALRIKLTTSVTYGKVYCSLFSSSQCWGPASVLVLLKLVRAVELLLPAGNSSSSYNKR